MFDRFTFIVLQSVPLEHFDVLTTYLKVFYLDFMSDTKYTHHSEAKRKG